MPVNSQQQPFWVYFNYILVSCTLISALAFVHALMIHDDLRPINFYIPIIAGIIFGYLLARNRLLSQTLTKIATTDSLTSIYNRMQFNNYLEQEINRANRYNENFSIIIMDIDHFKPINDQFGHATGDNVLVEFCQLIDQLNRSSDIFARYGGEEFIILVQNASLEQAQQHAQRLCHAVAEFNFNKVGKVTCSFGITEFRNNDDSSTSLLHRVDTAMYKAKENGRNQVVTG